MGLTEAEVQAIIRKAAEALRIGRRIQIGQASLSPEMFFMRPPGITAHQHVENVVHHTTALLSQEG